MVIYPVNGYDLMKIALIFFYLAVRVRNGQIEEPEVEIPTETKEPLRW